MPLNVGTSLGGADIVGVAIDGLVDGRNDTVALAVGKDVRVGEVEIVGAIVGVTVGSIVGIDVGLSSVEGANDGPLLGSCDASPPRDGAALLLGMEDGSELGTRLNVGTTVGITDGNIEPVGSSLPTSLGAEDGTSSTTDGIKLGATLGIELGSSKSDGEKLGTRLGDAPASDGIEDTDGISSWDVDGISDGISDGGASERLGAPLKPTDGEIDGMEDGASEGELTAVGLSVAPIKLGLEEGNTDGTGRIDGAADGREVGIPSIGA